LTSGVGGEQIGRETVANILKKYAEMLMEINFDISNGMKPSNMASVKQS
jgi:hypothetical protein